MPLIAQGKSTATKPLTLDAVDEPIVTRVKRYVLPEPRDRFDAEYVPNFPTLDTLAGEFAQYIALVIEHRAGAMAVIDELVFLDEQLADPELADHPKRSWAERRQRRLLLEQTMRLNTMLIQVYYANSLWIYFMPTQRADLGLDAMTGIDAASEYFGRDLPLIRAGPIQDAAPLPEGWRWSDDFVRNMLPELLDMTNECVF